MTLPRSKAMGSQRKQSSQWALKLELRIFENMIWPIDVAIYLLFSVLVPVGMLNFDLFVYMIYSSFPLGFIVLGESMVLLSGNFDLSLGEVAGFAGMAGAFVATIGVLPTALLPFSIFVPIIVGLACGLLNALLVTRAGLNPFLVTLGTSFAFQGAKLLTYPVSIFAGFPSIYLALGGNDVYAFTIFLASLVILFLVLNKTRFGSALYSTGSDAVASEMVGVSTKSVIFWAFVIGGGLAGAAGLFYTGFMKSISPLTGDTEIFPAFAGAVLGGISLKGGRGNLLNVLGGILCLSYIDFGLTMLAISPYIRIVLYGVLVVIAVFIDNLRGKIRERYMRTLRA
jgi:ribose/xylose/arabinose/galactoside ABC-type transport system permease subunit